ncbi:MAG: hypothetical protein GY794_14125, partial [bacterium]|nr:hypothetical protein [bacterium]
MKLSKRQIAVTVATLLLLATSNVFARDFYISIERGKGKTERKKKPAKDMGNIISKLAPGDTIH